MTYWLGVIVVTAIYMIAIIGVSVLSGFTGLFSLGHAAFMAIGAYTSAIVVNTFQVPIVVGLAAGTLLATLIGLFIGAPTLRIKGDYFIIATMGIGEAAYLLAQYLAVVLGGRGSLTGVILAAAILTPLPELLRFGSAQEWRLIIYGFAIVFVILNFGKLLMTGTPEQAQNDPKVIDAYLGVDD